MRIVVVNETGVHFHTGILKEEKLEYYCSCAKPKTPRNIELKENNLFITVPDKEYVALILRKIGTETKPLHQHNLDGVSIYTTEKYMAWIRFTNSYHSALQIVQRKNHLPSEEDKYVISTKKIEKIETPTHYKDPSKIFVYESSFGDVFNITENYTGEQVSGDQQMYKNLKRSSYTTLADSYDTCW